MPLTPSASIRYCTAKHTAAGTAMLAQRTRTQPSPSVCAHQRPTRTSFWNVASRRQSIRVGANPAQTAERALHAATFPGEIDIKLRSFIPAEAIKVTPFGIDTTALGVLPVIGGDGRSFSYDGGNSRAEIRLRLVISSVAKSENGGGNSTATSSSNAGSGSGMNGSSNGSSSGTQQDTDYSNTSGDGAAASNDQQQPQNEWQGEDQQQQDHQQQQDQQQRQQQHVRLDVVSRHIGTSYEYSPDDIEHVTGKPTWYYRLKAPDARVLKGDTLDITDDHINASLVLGESMSVVGAHIRISAVNPLIKPAPLVPASNSDLTVWFDLVEGTFWVTGGHDGFPCCELYINGMPVHRHDPIEAGKGPSFLAGPLDVKLDTPRAPIPAAAISQPVAQ